MLLPIGKLELVLFIFEFMCFESMWSNLFSFTSEPASQSANSLLAIGRLKLFSLSLSLPFFRRYFSHGISTFQK